MAEILKINKGSEDGLKQLLKSLLENGKIKGVVTLAKLDESDQVSYMLISKPEEIEKAVPLNPLMPVNAGKVLSRLTMMEPSDVPIAAVMRSCELRAFVELIKREQGNLDNILLISSTCGGVYPLKTTVSECVTEKLPQYWESVKKGEIVPGIRTSCSACVEFVPYDADMSIELVANGDIDKQCEVHLNTDKAKEIVAGIEGQRASVDINTGKREAFLAKRQAKREELFNEMKDFDMKRVFEKCIGCRACSRVCPICYCNLCFFESKEGDTSQYLDAGKLEKRGYAQVLPDKMFYHLVRSYHVSISCVECGQCADVCPVNIPLSVLALKAGDAVQGAYEYIPGRSLEETIPIKNFTPEEFAGVQ